MVFTGMDQVKLDGLMTVHIGALGYSNSLVDPFRSEIDVYVSGKTTFTQNC